MAEHKKNVYGKFKHAQNRFHYTYRQFSIDQIIAINLWHWSDGDVHSYSLKLWKYAIDFSFLKEITKENLFFFSVNREDHRNTFCSIYSKISDSFEGLDASSLIKNRSYFSAKNILRSIFLYPKTSIFEIDFKNRLRICAYFCYIFNSIDELCRTKPKMVKKFVSFFPISPIDSLLCQYYKNMGAKVYGLSHGAPYLWKKNIPIDCLNYENLYVDRCLVWGQMTKDAYMEYGLPEESIVVAGYPKQIERAAICLGNQMKKCLVLLSRTQFHDSNISLLKILKDFTEQHHFCLKIHPSCSYETYSRIAKENGYEILDRSIELTSCLDNNLFDFAIAVNTSAYYEVMAAGIPCLRYDAGDAYDLTYGDSHDAFSTKLELQNAIQWIKNSILNNQFQPVVDKILDYAIAPDIDRYRSILVDNCY